jgi:hypothetical protein
MYCGDPSEGSVPSFVAGSSVLGSSTTLCRERRTSAKGGSRTLSLPLESDPEDQPAKNQ